MRSVILAAVAVAGLVATVALSGCSGLGSATGSSSQPAPPPTRIVRLPGHAVHDGTAPLVVRLSGAPAATSPRPTIAPHVHGRWENSGAGEQFVPAASLNPCTNYTLTVPAGTRVAGGRPLGAEKREHLHVPCPTAKGAQAVLAELGYLPYHLHLSARARRHEAQLSSAQRRAYVAFHPSGHFKLRFHGAPQMVPGQLDQVTHGALMSFQNANGLKPDGFAGAQTWVALVHAAVHREHRKTTYSWADVSKGSPESLVVHRGDHVVVTSPANTGVSGAETPDGVFPIFEHLPSTTMTGTNPDGSHYSDPGVLYVNYFNGGDAIHAFQRASYGSPQSNGCVEVPTGAAQEQFAVLDIGDLVVVSG